MILVDTSVIVAWLDRNHDHHEACTEALALVHSWPHLTNDRRRTKAWAGMDWIWP